MTAASELAPYSLGDYACFRSSPRVMAAIDAVAASDLRDADGPARRLWDSYENEVAVLAYVNEHFAHADSADELLFWRSAKPWAIHDGERYRLHSRRQVLDHQGKQLIFSCQNDLSLQRARYVLQKEPGTIAWIDSFEPGSRFWDIGANVGTFALYAAVMREADVTAFEPVAGNYMALIDNILVNDQDRRVRALPVAVTDRCSISDMHMRDAVVGSALHTFGEAKDYTGSRFGAAYLQGAIGVPMDTLCAQFGLGEPHYIKIDVDGLERAIVAGGKTTLAKCRSVLVELDLDDEAEVGEITAAMSEAGLARDDTVPGNTPRRHPNALVYNMIFRRI